MRALRLYLLRVVVTGVLVVSCSSPLCRPDLVEQGGRCVAREVSAKPCEPACSPTSHEVCDGDAESPSCICAPGYEGNPCTWGGVLKDPSFEDTEAWTGSLGATVVPFNDGVGLFPERVACNGGTLSQLVEMPSYAAAEPLVAEVVYRSQDLWGMSIGFNRAWTQLRPTTDDAWQTERVCLGEAAYNGPVLVQLGAREQHPSCFDEPVGGIEVDRLDIVPAETGECPRPGEALNGTGEVGQGGWQFDTEGAAEAGFVDGVGRGGTSGVRLAREGNDQAFARTTLSVPSSESLESPALRFWWRGTSGLVFKFQIGRFENWGSGTGHLPLDDAIGNGSDTSYVYCLPPWTHGNVVDLLFTPLLNSSRDASELVLDDLEIVSDERCGTSKDVLDPGFEAGPARIMGATLFTRSATVTLINDSELARTGDGVLEFLYRNEDALAFWETWVFVPGANGEEGPAVVFWSNIPVTSQKPIRSVLGRAAVNPATLEALGVWRRNEVCLFPEWSGRWYRLQLRLGEIPAMGTAPVDPPIRIYIDDLELTTSTACRGD